MNSQTSTKQKKPGRKKKQTAEGAEVKIVKIYAN